MRAAVRSRFGPPRDVIELRELERPAPADDEVLVKVRATSVNIAEWYSVTGRPWIARPTMGLRRPKDVRLGVDYALTSSCYDPGAAGRPCQRCDACLLRAKGFAEAGAANPLLARFAGS